MSNSDKDIRKSPEPDESVDENSGAKAESSDSALVKRQLGPLPMQTWDDIVGQRIAQAMEDGEFDNLPGKGKPQQLTTNPWAGDNHLAFDIMANNDISPSWISRRKAVQAQIDKLREEIIAAAVEHRRNMALVASSLGVDAVDVELAKNKVNSLWTQKTDVWKEEIAKINRKIRDLNLEQPISDMEMLPLRLSEELIRAGHSHA